MTRKTINTVETGKYVPSTYLALKLARVFGVPVEEVFQLDPECIALQRQLIGFGERIAGRTRTIDGYAHRRIGLKLSLLGCRFHLTDAAFVHFDLTPESRALLLQYLPLALELLDLACRSVVGTGHLLQPLDIMEPLLLVRRLGPHVASMAKRSCSSAVGTGFSAFGTGTATGRLGTCRILRWGTTTRLGLGSDLGLGVGVTTRGRSRVDPPVNSCCDFSRSLVRFSAS